MTLKTIKIPIHFSDVSNGLPSEYFCPSRATVVETSLRKNISISTDSAGIDTEVSHIKIQLKSNKTHIMCNGINDIYPQIIDKYSDEKLICQDETFMFVSLNYKKVTKRDALPKL